MKQAILLAAFTTASTLIYSQDSISLVKSKDSPELIVHVQTGFQNKASAEQMETEIMKVVGLQPNFILEEGKVDNIEAFISHQKRYILYNQKFIDWINVATNDKWASLALLAHEIGHHLNGHTIRKGESNPGLELEADQFAGFILNRLGASLEQAQAVMQYIATTESSKTHPAKADRMNAIYKGWESSDKASSHVVETAKNNSSVADAKLAGN